MKSKRHGLRRHDLWCKKERVKSNKVRNLIRGIFYQLRLKVIKLLIGNLSVIVNVKIYGTARAGSYGLIYNSVFQGTEFPMINAYCGHIAAPLGAEVVVNHCIFDASGKERIKDEL